jgi:hypothetical protein
MSTIEGIASDFELAVKMSTLAFAFAQQLLLSSQAMLQLLPHAPATVLSSVICAATCRSSCRSWRGFRFLIYD